MCNPSSLEINSLENVKPGINPRFFNQKIAAKEPEKKIPSTAAKATSRSPKVEFSSEIQRRAHSAFLLMQGTIEHEYQYFGVHIKRQETAHLSR